MDDAYFANTAATGATGLQLPTVWNIFTAIQHYWVPDVRTSLYGGYVQFRANSSAVDTLVCAPNGLTAGCANWAAWQVGSRTIWNPVRNLDLGVEALYSDLSKSAFSGATVAFVVDVFRVRTGHSQMNRVTGTLDMRSVIGGMEVLEVSVRGLGIVRCERAITEGDASPDCTMLSWRPSRTGSRQSK